MANNKGKQFESKVREAFQKIPGVSIDRIPDQTMRHKGACNICDFIVYKEPYEYYVECKSVHGNTLSIYSVPKLDKHGVLHGFYGNITDAQWEGLLQKSQIPGVRAGILCWWVNKDITKYIPIQELEFLRQKGNKSFRYDWNTQYTVDIDGRKKRVFFDYNMDIFFEEVIL